jgi:tol-pal system beta propeller repeat protein TolB
MVRQSGGFQVPGIAPDRSEIIRDSLANELDLRSAHATGVLTADAFVRDSLMKVSAAPPPKKKQNTKERLAARIAQAQRDSLVKEIDVRRVAILERAHRDTVERDSVLPLLVSADSAERDLETRAFRAAVHTVSDEIQRWLTGTPGIAATRIAYVQKSNLHVVDSDGAFDDVISTPGAALSPAWHPNGRAIVYADFNDAGTQIGEVNLDTRKAWLIPASNRGLNITPVFTPDGRNIVYASGGETPADLVMTDADGTTPARKLDFGKFENSSPSFSPDGSRMVFMSPRPALTPQLFTMNVDGTKIKQLTPSIKGKRSYRTGPDWSPTGEMVAYEQQNGDFQVWTIAVATGKMKQLTSVAENEDPSWAPDGRHLAITSTRGGDRQIWILDAVSGRFRQLTHSPGARLAAWSPTLKREVAVAAATVSGGGNK